MKLLLFAVLLSVMQAAPPVPRKAADNPADATNKPYSQSSRNKPVPAATPPTANAGAPKKDEEASKHVRAEDAQKTVRIGELPSVSVTSNWRDDASLIFSLVLVIVTAIQAYLLCHTLKFVRIQAAIMRRQTRHIARQALSMRYQTTILRDNVKALINAERPWLLIEIKPAEFDANIYILRAVNKGKTPAEMKEGWYKFDVYPVDGFIPSDDLMGPFIAPIQVLTVSGDRFEIGRLSPSTFPVNNNVHPPKALFAYGKITYWDTFTDRTKKGVKPYETHWCLTYEAARKIWYRTANGYSKNT